VCLLLPLPLHSHFSGLLRPDDFYNCFLGSTMVYTSGIRYTENDSLEDMQLQKIDLVCNKIQLKAGQRLLDIGCGWGSLAIRATQKGVRAPLPVERLTLVSACPGSPLSAARQVGWRWGLPTFSPPVSPGSAPCLLCPTLRCVARVDLLLLLPSPLCVQALVTGVTLSSEQVAWATEVAARKKVPCPNFLRMDYRDIPMAKYDKITCLEMAEHVGVKNFSKFLHQVCDSSCCCVLPGVSAHMLCDGTSECECVRCMYRGLPYRRCEACWRTTVCSTCRSLACAARGSSRTSHGESGTRPPRWAALRCGCCRAPLSPFPFPLMSSVSRMAANVVCVCVLMPRCCRGLFMAKYVFPGADASMPLGWVVDQLECAGFEVAQMDTIGVHCTCSACVPSVAHQLCPPPPPPCPPPHCFCRPACPLSLPLGRATCRLGHPGGMVPQLDRQQGWRHREVWPALVPKVGDFPGVGHHHRWPRLRHLLPAHLPQEPELLQPPQVLGPATEVIAAVCK
jgi:hypothetical protein